MPTATTRRESTGQAARRPYRSPLRERRAAETRASLIAAAHRLFVANGWGATGMREVAAEAGVATETLYAYFASKRALFQAIVDVAVVGDDLPVPMAERPEFAALARGRHGQRTEAAARLLTSVHSRTAGLARVLREAAASDSEIADMLAATRERQRRDVASAMALILGRPPTPVERDGVWAITSPEIYVMLVEISGWSIEQYETWMAETLAGLVPRARPTSRSPR